LASTWQVLKVKLEHHSSPLVVAALCDLFSLTPSLVVETQEYEVNVLYISKQFGKFVYQIYRIVMNQ
jgi:hypothetical protein